MVARSYQGRGAASPSSQIERNAGNIQARIFKTGCLVKFVEKLSKKGKQHGAIEKQNLDNVRKLRGIYHVDVEDMEFKDTVKNARKKWKCKWNLQCRVKKEPGREKL